MKALGVDTLRAIARELVETVRKNVTIDWTVRENVRAQLRVLSCFNFRAPDEALFTELAELTRRGYGCYRDAGYVG